MKRLPCFIVFCLFVFASGYAQVNKKLQRPAVAEQKEITADNHLEKERQLKDLSAKPQLLADTAGSKKAKEPSEKVNGKRKKEKAKRGKLD